ncbi:MAG TPA: MFS transporter, partial [Candidatus Aminicenantes bacterium]|nr:MFS transporter [Candidatus Aminicenantes bacterium]
MKPLRGRTAVFIGARTVSNTAYRMVYPFLPVLGRALGVDLATMSLALSARAASGALGPLLAPLTDRRGRRFGLSLGLGLFAAGAFLAAVGPGFTVFAAALVLMTVGKYVLDPAILAHLSDIVPYERRGRALALTELSWSLAFLLGVPAAGFLIARWGWRSPFLALGGLGLAGLLAIEAAAGRRGIRRADLADGPGEPGRGAGHR